MDNIGSLIDRIISKKIVFNYKDNLYYYLYPNSELKAQASLLYEDAFEDLKYSESSIDKEEIMYYLTEIEMANHTTEQILKQSYKSLENIKIDLFKYFFKDSKKKEYRNKIKNSKLNISKLEDTIHYLDPITRESIASNIQNEFLLINGIYDKNNTLIFNYDKLDEINYVFFNNLRNSIYSSAIPSDKFKEIARSNLWRSMWTIENHNIFPDPIIEWSEEQKTIIHISQMYRNIYQHPECPPDEVIEDTDALEGWSLLQTQKNKQEKDKKGVQDIVASHKNAGEIFLMAETPEDMERIQGMNDEDAARRQQSKFDYFEANKGRDIKEQELPDIKTDILSKYREMSKRK